MTGVGSQPENPSKENFMFLGRIQNCISVELSRGGSAYLTSYHRTKEVFALQNLKKKKNHKTKKKMLGAIAQGAGSKVSEVGVGPWGWI